MCFLVYGILHISIHPNLMLTILCGCRLVLCYDHIGALLTKFQSVIDLPTEGPVWDAMRVGAACDGWSPRDDEKQPPVA